MKFLSLLALPSLASAFGRFEPSDPTVCTCADACEGGISGYFECEDGRVVLYRSHDGCNGPWMGSQDAVCIKPFWHGEVDYFSKKHCDVKGDVFEVYYSDAGCTTETVVQGQTSRSPLPKAEDGCYCDRNGILNDPCIWDCSSCNSEGDVTSCSDGCSVETLYEACAICSTYAPSTFMDTTSDLYTGCAPLLAGGGR